ncbi:hypothetical protein [Massilia sp. YIM B02443]|uniref:hypothetical protein n=1 Tax=Massilia sp. YIM B02443 TaxID=3050127 RepID=UPI0025B633FB|nr:hypothetical protein [Massilia sp. YIM B02443]MDN4039910.1 hypothetical protein [Massilia sp. YIM B02443]
MEIVNIDAANQSMELPIDKKTLGEFISGLLGQPQSIGKRFEDAFSVDHDWFIHFFSLILQRIQQQNSPEPLAFEARILYKDQLQRKITSWQAFQHFSETQNIVSIAVQFNLALLIHFPSKELPERQELIITFDSTRGRRFTGMFEGFLGASTPLGIIDVEIRHTERTWADDILRLIETEISNIQVSQLKLRTHLRRFFAPFSVFAFPIMMLASLAYSTWSGRTEGLTERAEKLLKVTDQSAQVLHEKINILLVEAAKSSVSRSESFTFLLYSLFISVLFYLGGMFLAQPNPSFVVLSKAAEKNRTQTLNRQKRRGLMLVVSTILSLALGIAGNFIYDSVK